MQNIFTGYKAKQSNLTCLIHNSFFINFDFYSKFAELMIRCDTFLF